MAKTLFTNVAVFDGTGAPTFKGYVLVDETRIVEAKPGQPATSVADARVIDGAGATLIPGLVDAHAHLALGSTIHQMSRPADRSDEETALLIAHSGRVFLDSGFTSAYSGGSGSPRAEIAARNAFDAGWVPGPRMRTSSFERTPGGPMGLKTRFTGAAGRPSAKDEVVAFVREMKEVGVDSVKFLLNGISAFHPGSNSGEQFHDEEIEAAAAEATSLGVSLTAHCYTAHAVELAARTGFRMLYHCNYADTAALDAIEARKGDIFIGPAPGIVEADLVRGPKFGIMASPEQRTEQQELAERIKTTVAEMRRRGFQLVPGGDYGFPWNPVGRNARDLTLFVEWFGFTPAEAIAAATGLGGKVMARGHELGLIREGYLADLVLVKGDPTRDITLLENADNLVAIMKDGRLHKAPAAARA